MPAASYVSPPSSPISHHRRSSLSVLTRNIDQVLLGSILFNTWYYSPYPDSIIFEEGANKGQPLPTAPSTISTATPVGPRHGAKSTNNALTIDGPHKSSNHDNAMCPRLHVCPRCFAYTPNPLDYVTHLRHHCPLQPQPGSRHTDREDSTVGAENDASGGVPSSAAKVYDHDGYAVWEVDGEVEKLYCQNLSLFGKLFLEQKSVFFDVSGFMYYVLTYTPPSGTSVNETDDSQRGGAGKTGGRGTSKKRKAPIAESKGPEDWIQSIHSGPQTLGFFSKEKLSWDSNNLACIVIFPPYQHRSLGKLLMSVSYKLSGWEWEGGVIGGPEKPLSAMGKKSYTRFWEERVARYLLGGSRDADGRRILDRANAVKKKNGKMGKKKKKEVLMVRDIGERTGMLAEDVVVALVSMGVCERTGRRGVKKAAQAANGLVNGSCDQHAPTQPDQKHTGNMVLKRSKVSDWAEQHGVEVKNPVAEEGFLGEWALSDTDDEEMGTEDNDGDAEDSE